MITLKTLSEATAQEVFDQVVDHLETQDTKSADSISGMCRYREDTGDRLLRCAAGCLISDEEYDRRMEGANWKRLASTEVVPMEHSNLIHGLQNVHDGVPVHRWSEVLKTTAEDFGLKYNGKA